MVSSKILKPKIKDNTEFMISRTKTFFTLFHEITKRPQKGGKGQTFAYLNAIFKMKTITTACKSIIENFSRTK